MAEDTQVVATPQVDASIESRLERYLDAEIDEQEAQGEPAEETEPQEVEPDEKDGEDESEEPQLAISDLSKYLGVEEDLLDSDDEGNLIIKTKIDGKEGTAKFTDLIKSYQLQGHFDNQGKALAEQQRNIQSAIQETQKVVQSKIQMAEDLTNMAYQQLMDENSSINWSELSRENPAEYVAKKQEFQQRNAQIDHAMSILAQHRQESEANQDKWLQENYQAQAARLPELIPEWKDQAVAQKDGAEIVEYGLKAGLTQEELSAISYGTKVMPANSVYIKILRDAMLYNKLQSSKAPLEKKVRIAPKLVKSGAAQQPNRQDKTVRDLKSKIRSSGGKDGIVEYLLATGKA